jgi:glycosyltransferase involved in cell wall biosynthesis
MRASVLVNCYNNGKWLAACLDSILAQTRPAEEIIVYDDGSTDDSVEIARSYAPSVTVIAGSRTSHPPHINQGEAIRQAFLRSTGDIIFLLDSDDLFHPGKIARYLEAFSTPPQPVLVQAPLRLIDAKGQTLRRSSEPSKHTANPLETAYTRKETDLFYPTSALAFTRQFLATQFPLNWEDGIPAWSDMRLCIAALFAGPVRTLEDELGSWRRHAQADSIIASQKHTYLLTQTWRRSRLFNQNALLASRPPIPVWKNRRFFGQLMRVMFPPFAYQLFTRYRRKRVPHGI